MRVKRISFVFIIFFINLVLRGLSQEHAIYSGAFIKENAVIIRLAPSSKKIFDLGILSGYKLTRYENINGTLQKPVTYYLKPYNNSDSVKWRFVTSENLGVIKQLIFYEELKNADAIQQQTIYTTVLSACNYSKNLAKACGIYLADTVFEKNKAYVYKVELVAAVKNIKIKTPQLNINTGKISTLPLITNLTAVFKNKLVKLKWKETEYANEYAGFNVERSEDGINFKKINKSPVVLMRTKLEPDNEFVKYKDTMPKKGVTYYYRIKGINFFAEESNFSNVIKGTCYEALTSAPTIYSLKVINNSHIYIHWKMFNTNENKLPKEYLVMRANTDLGKYETIYTTKNEFSFIDKKPNPSNYYKVCAISEGNDTLASFSKLGLIADTIPPAVPQGLKALVDEKGSVKLTWYKNTDTDFKGYKIYRTNALHEEFVQLSKLFVTDTNFYDKLSLKTLNKKVYYALAATDNNFNSSKLSLPVELKRPDTIAPVAAIITELKKVKNGIEINWIPSSSNDVVQYTLYRKETNNLNEFKLVEWDTVDYTLNYIDTNIADGYTYLYKIITADDSKNLSTSNILQIKYVSGYTKKITDINYMVNRDLKTITLSWNYPIANTERFIIYRSRQNEKPVILKTVSGTTFKYVDEALHIGNTYEYRVKALLKDGKESLISDGFKVEY